MLSLVFCLMETLAQATPRVVIVSSDSTTAYLETTQAFISELARGGVSAYDIRRLNVSEWPMQAAQPEKPTLYVTLGMRATEALATSPVPVLSVLIPRSTFERILRNSGRKSSSSFTAIYLDQTFQRQLALIRLALPQAKRLGVLWGPDSWVKASALRSLAPLHGFSLTEAGLTDSFNVFPELQQVLNDSDVFFAVADPIIFNRNTIQNLLLTTFRANVPVVAFSPAYVQAGALLALHTSPEQVGRQAAAVVLQALSGKPLPDSPLEANDFEVSVNTHVARSLNLSLDAQALRLALRRLEHLP